jgi:hypothetical protein
MDALLANWDVIGASYDNLMISPHGAPVRLDTGGALRFRAQGGPKGPAFNADPTEFETLRTNGTARSIFGKMTDADLISSLEEIKGFMTDAVRADIRLYDSNPEEMIAILEARHKSLMDKLDNLLEQRRKAADRSAIPVNADAKAFFDKDTDVRYASVSQQEKKYEWHRENVRPVWQELEKKLTFEEKTSVYQYNGDFYEPINAKLRTGKEPFSLDDRERINNFIKNIDSAFDKAAPHKGTRVITRFQPESVLMGSKPGEVVEIKGHFSAGDIPQSYFWRDDSCAVELLVREGQTGVLAGFNAGETELLVRHGAKIRIIAVKQLKYSRGGLGPPTLLTVYQAELL